MELVETMKYILNEWQVAEICKPTPTEVYLFIFLCLFTPVKLPEITPNSFLRPAYWSELPNFSCTIKSGILHSKRKTITDVEWWNINGLKMYWGVFKILRSHVTGKAAPKREWMTDFMLSADFNRYISILERDKKSLI